MVSPEYAGILPAVPFLFGILLYNLAIILLKVAIEKISPSLFHYLKGDRTNRFDPFVAFAMGWLITLFSTPICTSAALHSTNKANVFDQTPESTLLEQICVGSRVVLWVGETPRLQFSSMYTAHHVFSIAAFLGIVHIRAPVQQLFVLYAALGTELVSTAIALLKVLGWKASNSRVIRSATYLNIILLVSIRVPGTCWCLWLVVTSGISGMRMIANVGPLLIYVLYLLYCAYRQSQILGIIKVEWRTPAHVEVHGRLTISFYAMCLLFAWIAVTLSTMWLYDTSSAAPLNNREVQDIVTIAVKVGIAGLIGAAGLPKLVGAKRLPKEKRPTCASRGLWLQAGEFSMILALFSSKFGDAHQYRALICAVALSLPLGEAIGRLGCYFGGCCDGRASRNKGEANDLLVKSVPLTSMWINGIVYVSLASIRVNARMSPEHTVCLAVALNGMTRIFTDSLREDIPRIRMLASQSPTTVFAFLQSFGAFALFSRLDAIGWESIVTGVSQCLGSLLVGIVSLCVAWLLREPILRGTGWKPFLEGIGSVLTILTRPLVLSSLASLMLGAIVLVEGYKVRVTGAAMEV